MPPKRQQAISKKASSSRQSDGISGSRTSSGNRKRKASPSKGTETGKKVRERKGARANTSRRHGPRSRLKSNGSRPETPPILTHAPTRRLNVYVFGTNYYGELGLGDATNEVIVREPIVNPKLRAETIGVVQIAAGRSHSVALTHDNRILTWGVNDDGQLGRDTGAKSKSKKARKSSDKNNAEESDTEELGLLDESTPMPVDSSHFPDGTVFTQVVATDNATFALTNQGLVYGWGTFLNSKNDRILGFSAEGESQKTPRQVPNLKKVIKLAAGAQHVLALTSAGSIFTWGCGDRGQLGRRLLGRLNRPTGLVPGQCALPKNIVDIGTGLYHSFAIRRDGKVYAWGANNYGQPGHTRGAGHTDAGVPYPTEVRIFRNHAQLTFILGGRDHSIAVTEQGQCLAWGRINQKALGILLKDIPPSKTIYGAHSEPLILKEPTVIQGISGKVVHATAGGNHSIAVTEEGEAYSWGLNAQNRAGHTDFWIELPTRLQNEHVKGKKLVAAAAGEQFSLLAGEYQPDHPRQAEADSAENFARYLGLFNDVNDSLS